MPGFLPVMGEEALEQAAAEDVGKGVGTWLVKHAVEWLRLGHCDRVVMSVAQEDEDAGAGRFYRRFGWDVLIRQKKGWKRAAMDLRSMRSA